MCVLLNSLANVAVVYPGYCSISRNRGVQLCCGRGILAARGRKVKCVGRDAGPRGSTSGSAVNVRDRSGGLRPLSPRSGRETTRRRQGPTEQPHER